MIALATRLSVAHCRIILTIVVLGQLSASGALADELREKIRASARVARSTTLYRDCQAVQPPDRARVNFTKAAETWRGSYDAIKRHWRDNEGRFARHALTLEAILTNGRFSTGGTPREVLDRLEGSIVRVKDDPDPAYAFSDSPLEIIVTIGLIRHICDYLLPADSFDKLVRDAEAASRAGGEGPDKGKALSDKATELAARFMVRSTRYAGLRIFVLGHESSHLSLDRYSKDLAEAKDYQENGKECLGIFYRETRGDIIGLSAVRDIPIADKVDELIRKQMSEFSKADLENMGSVATQTGFRDFLTIIEKEKAWQPDATCTYGAFQRRQQLEEALRRSDAKSKNK